MTNEILTASSPRLPALVVAAALAMVACKNEKRDLPEMPETATQEARIVSPPAEATPSGPCVPTSFSNLPGVTVSFPEGARCAFSLAEVKNGVRLRYEVKVEEALDITFDHVDASGCMGPDPTGLAFYQEVGDGIDDLWCLCDEGECHPRDQTSRLVVGEHRNEFVWDGVNWTGPSDYDQEKGTPFAAGEYFVTVRATGTYGPGKPYRVEASLPILLTAGDAPDRVVVDAPSDRSSEFAEVALVAERGTLRDVNRDRYLVAPNLGVVAVADGRDGKAPSERASQIVVDVLRAAYGEAPRPVTITDVLQRANQRIASAQDTDRPVGASVAAVASSNTEGKLRIANVGTGRIYRIRDGRLERLSKDQTLAEQLVLAGELTPDKVEPLHHFVATHLLGPRPTVEVAETEVDGKAGDLLIVTSDGLHRALSEEQILALSTPTEDLQAIARKLHSEAISLGSNDNLTIALIRLN